MQCKLKFGAKVVNEDFELEDGKYNAIVSNISSPVFNEKGDLVKEGVFEAMTFNNKAEADKYIDDRYNRLLQEYNKLQSNALNDLQKELVEYQKERAIEEAEAAFEGVETEEFDDDIEYGDTNFPEPYSPFKASDSANIDREVKRSRQKREATAAVKKRVNDIFVRLSEIMADFDNKEALEKVGEEGLINAMYIEIGKLRAISKALNYEMTEQEKADYKEIDEFVSIKLRKIYFDKMLADKEVDPNTQARYEEFFNSLESDEKYKYKILFERIDDEAYEEIDEETKKERSRLADEFLELYQESKYFEEYGDSIKEENFVITSLEPNSVALISDINIVETVEFEDFPKEAITQETVDSLKVLLEENRASLELMGDELAIIIREDKPGIIINGKIQEKPKVKAVILTKEQALEILNMPIQVQEDISSDVAEDTSMEEEPFDADVDEKIDEETDTTVVGDVITVDPDTGETLPYNLKASGTPLSRIDDMGNVLLYTTVKPSQTKTVNGREELVNSRHESAMSDLWINNDYKEEYGEDKFQEFIDKSKEHIDYLTKNGKIKEGTTIAYRKAKRSIYKRYNHELKLKILNENQHEVLLMGVIDNGVFYPIGEIAYHDGLFDSKGKSLKDRIAGTEEQRHYHHQLYHTIRELWNTVGYEPSVQKGYTHEYEATASVKRGERETIADLILDRQEEVYFMSSSGLVYKYNKDEQGNEKWENITNTREGKDIKKSYASKSSNKKIKGYSNAVIKVGNDYEFLFVDTTIIDTSDYDTYNRYINDLLDLENVDQETINEFQRYNQNSGLQFRKIGNNNAFTFGNPIFNLRVSVSLGKGLYQENKGINEFTVEKRNGKEKPSIKKVINLKDGASVKIIIGKDNNGDVIMFASYYGSKDSKTGEPLFGSAGINLGKEFTHEGFIRALQTIQNSINNKGKGFIKIETGATKNIANNLSGISSMPINQTLKRRIVIKPNFYPYSINYDEQQAETEDVIIEEEVYDEQEQKIADAIALMKLDYPANGQSNNSGFIESDNFDNEDQSKHVNVFLYNDTVFVAGISKGKNVVMDIDRLNYPDVEKDEKYNSEKEALKAYNNYMNGMPSDIFPIGYMTSALENETSYLVNDSGDIVSVASGSAVFVNNKTVSKRIKTGVQNNNRSILGVSEEQEQTTPATETDIYTNTEQKQQKQKMPTFKFMDDGILNFSGFQIENDLTKQKDVYDLLVKKLGKDKVDGLKGKVYSLNGQWLFNHNGKRLVMFVKVGDFLNPVYFSSQGTSGKSLTWHPFFGIDSQAGWIYKREFNPSTGKLSFSNRWKEYSNSILLLENVLQDLFLNFNVQDFKSELLNKIEEQDLRNNIFVNNQVLEDYVVENGEMRVVTTDSSDQYVVTMLYYMNQKTTPATETDVYADTEQDNNTSGAQNTSTPTGTTTTNKANTIGDFDFSLFNNTQKLKTDENQTDENQTDENQTDESPKDAKPIDAKDVQDVEDLPLSTSETKQTQQDISEAKRVLANIVPFDVEEMDPMIQNMVNDRTPIGAFYKNVIYLLDGTVKFHEAFHGVFRTLLTDQEVKETLDAAKKKYAKPTLEDLRKLRNLTEKNKQLTSQQLIDLYYEEKLAEDFQKYMDTGKSFFQRVWQKIMDIINFITGKDGDRIYALFRSIEQGKYAKSKQRTQSPFAFREPAFATVNSIRSNAYGKAAQYFMPPNQTKIVASLVAKEIFDDKIDRKKRSEYFPYFRKVRETFNPKKWYEFFKFNNDPNLVANMMTIIDYYNALAVPGDTLYMIDANGKVIPIVNADNIINKNLNGLIRDVDGLLKFYVNDETTDVDDEFNDDDYEDDNGESVELFGKDSYKFGGFKSESKAMRNLMSIITYNKALFSMANGYMPTPDGFTGEIIMPSQAESLYNKITLLTTGATKEDILERIKEGANDDKNPDVRAFYDYIMGKIAQESGIDNRDILVQEPGKYNNSPTYNLLLKSFYKNNHDYVHLIKNPRSGGFVSYYPNKRSYITSAVESWEKNLERLISDTNDFERRRSDIANFEAIMLNDYKDIDSKEFMREMNKAAKLLFNATGISVSPLYLKYSYVKINDITSSGLFSLTIPYIDIGSANSVLKELTRLPTEYASNAAIRKIAEGSVLFDDKQTSFMLRNAENELIYTSLYNSYDTEIFNAIQRSFVDGVFRPEILKQTLENMGYYPSFVDRFMSMVSNNPIFYQEDLSAEDFNIMYSFGMDDKSYNKLNENKRKSYRVGVYASPPANIKAKKGGKRLYNPFIIEAKNTSKLFTFSDTSTGSTYENGELKLTEKALESLESLYLIERDSVLRYQNDIKNLIATGNIDAFIKDYHYREMTIDGFNVKVIFDGENYYEVEDKWDSTTFKTHQVHQGYTVRRINKPSGFKNPKGAELFNFKGVQNVEYIEEWANNKYEEFVKSGNAFEVKTMLSNITGSKATDNDVVAFYFNDMIASGSIQYLMFGGSPTINHKDFIDVTKRNAGINANGSSIGNTSTKFAMITSIEESIDSDIIKQQNSGDSLSQDVQDAQNYATPLWYFSKYAKYKGVASEKGELRDIALKVVAGIKLNTKEISFLEKNNMLLTDRKIVVRNTFVYDKTSVHIQAREKTSRLLVSNEVALNNWKKYLSNPNPEDYNKLIAPMYAAKPGFEYHHNMLNSMEAQGIDIVMVTSASKNSSFNIASDPSQLRGFDVDDRFIHEQVRTDNIKKKITDPTQALALNWSEHQDSFFAKLADKFVELQTKRMEIATNQRIASFFKGKDNEPDYEAIWDVIKDTISVNDPQLYELLDVQQGNPKYNWNIPVVNDKVISAFMSAMSNEGIKQKVKGSSLNLVSSYGHGQDLNWKVTDDRYPGTYFSEVYVSQYFLDKMGMQVGDVMWGTRIPTQDKHSMGNLKIKGVIEGPYAMSVMLPKELLFLSGADHDLDKIYVKTFAYNYSQDIRDRVYDGNTNIVELYNEIVKNNPDYNPSDVMNDLMLMTQIAITHNVGNQSIYATKASLKAIKDSGVRGVEKPIKSTIAFEDRNTSEESNYTSKGGIGPSAVLNIVYQLMAKYFPDKFKFTNSEGTRVNDLISTQISGMTDDPKEQLMSRYGLSKSNINKVISIMKASGIPYKEALIAIRDQEYTYATPDESFEVLAKMFDNNLTSTNPKAQQYESEGYIIEYGKEVVNPDGTTYFPIINMYNPNFNVELAKVYDTIFFNLGVLSRLNRKMPVKPQDYYNVFNAITGSDIGIQRNEITESSADYKKITSMFNQTNDDYIVKDGKIFINLGNQYVMYSFVKLPVKAKKPSKKAAKEMNRDMIFEILTKDQNTFQTVAAYITNGEFAGKMFMKFNPYYRSIYKRIYDVYKKRSQDADPQVDGMQIIGMYKKILDNLDNYIISIMSARRYLTENNRTLYNGLLTETVRTKDGKEVGYMEALSRRILMEEEIRILKDVKYKQEKSNVTGKTYHIANLITVGEESDYIRTMYSNDYANMINASDNRDVLQKFINAPNKGKFIQEMSIGDAKLLMALFMFDYALMKDAMMFNATSFSKIIDPRLFVNYGKSLTNMQKAFTNIESLKREFGVDNENDVNNKLNDMADSIIRNIDAFLKTRDAGVVGAGIYESYKPKELPDAKVIYVGSGLGKTSFIKNREKEGDNSYVDFEDILAEALKDITPNVKYTPAEASRIFGVAILKNSNKEEEIQLSENLINGVIILIKNKYKGKTILSTMGNEKIRHIGMEYSAYFAASESNIPNVVERVSKRKNNQYRITVEAYKDRYVNSLLRGVSANKIFYVDDNFEATFKSMSDGAFGENKPVNVTYNGTGYVVKEEQIFDDSNTDITNTLDENTKARLFAERDFQQGLSELVEINGEQFYQYEDGLTVFRLKTNTNLNTNDVTRFKQAVAKQKQQQQQPPQQQQDSGTETEQEQEQETPTVKSVYDEYKSKIEKNFGPIEYNNFERIVNKYGIYYIIDLLKNC